MGYRNVFGSSHKKSFVVIIKVCSSCFCQVKVIGNWSSFFMCPCWCQSWQEALCFQWMRNNRTTWRDFHYLWHRCSLGLKDDFFAITQENSPSHGWDQMDTARSKLSNGSWTFPECLLVESAANMLKPWQRSVAAFFESSWPVCNLYKHQFFLVLGGGAVA